jgi:hypothetical protein
MNLVTPKAGAERELSFKKPASGFITLTPDGISRIFQKSRFFMMNRLSPPTAAAGFAPAPDRFLSVCVLWLGLVFD